MFKGSSSVTFQTNKDRSQVLKTIEEQLEAIGASSVSNSGLITLGTGRYNGFGFTTRAEGRVTDRDGKYNVTVDVEAVPGALAWIIGICFFPLGALIFLLPYNAQTDMQRKSDQALNEIRFLLDSK